MHYKIIVRPLAAFEAIEAVEWYEEQRTGLGTEFLDALDDFYETLQQNPLIYSYYEKPVRQGKLKRFPYLVVYEVFKTDIVIYSIFMSRKDLSQKRIK